MKLTQFIKELEEIRAKCGDIEVAMKDLEFGDYVSAKIGGVKLNMQQPQCPGEPDLGMQFVAIDLDISRDVITIYKFE